MKVALSTRPMANSSIFRVGHSFKVSVEEPNRNNVVHLQSSAMEASTTEVVLKGESPSSSVAGTAAAYFVKINAPHSTVSNPVSNRHHTNIMWQLCTSDGNEAQDHPQLQRDTSRYIVSQSAGDLPQSLLSLLLTSIQQMQSRLDNRFDVLERRMTNIERALSNMQKQQAIVLKKRKRCATPLLLNETKQQQQHQMMESSGPFNGNIGCIGATVVHSAVATTAHNAEGTFISSCSSKTLSEFMKSAQMESIPCLKGQCTVSDNGYILANVADDSGGVHSFEFSPSLVEKILKDNPPEPTGWSASKALVTLLDHIYHPLELAMRRLPALPASNSLSSNLQGRQRSELFVGTQYEDGIPFSADRLLPCCKLIEHYYQGWRYKAFERNHAFREIVHKKCRTRRRDLKQYLLQCGKTKEQVLDMIIKGVDLPPRDFLLK